MFVFVYKIMKEEKMSPELLAADLAFCADGGGPLRSRTRLLPPCCSEPYY